MSDWRDCLMMLVVSILTVSAVMGMLMVWTTGMKSAYLKHDGHQPQRFVFVNDK